MDRVVRLKETIWLPTEGATRPYRPPGKLPRGVKYGVTGGTIGRVTAEIVPGHSAFVYLGRGYGTLPVAERALVDICAMCHCDLGPQDEEFKPCCRACYAIETTPPEVEGERE